MSRPKTTTQLPPTPPAIHGLEVSPRTQCVHWHSDLDIIAIRHKCCRLYYACISCHEVLAGHPPETWLKEERDTKAVLCGNCRSELTVAQYLASGNCCPECDAQFNPGCARHYDLYFEM
ncbi:CHY zinc finger family protein [Mariannaea sp. PMI_226]|nr:CHY zinc finger family protein [Mariannaea sp. PMI_226]